MNRYILEGITNDLHNGKRIVVVAPTTRQSSFVFRSVADALSSNEAVARIRRANGQESITMHNGGHLTFIAVNMQGGRGFTADTVVLMSSEHLTDTQVNDVRRYATITRAEIVQA